MEFFILFLDHVLQILLVHISLLHYVVTPHIFDLVLYLPQRIDGAERIVAGSHVQIESILKIRR